MKHLKKGMLLLLVFAMIFSLSACFADRGYAIAVEQGFTGSYQEWLESLRGSNDSTETKGSVGQETDAPTGTAQPQETQAPTGTAQPQETQTPTGTVKPQEPQVPAILQNLPEANFNNEIFIYMCFAGEELVNYDETNTSDPISADQFRRTQWVNDQFNCLIEMDVVGGGENSFRAIEANDKAGGGNFNAAMMHPTEGRAATLTGGYCMDLLTVSTLHFEGEWYNQDMVAYTQTNGKLLGMESDFTVAGSGMTALVYNEQLYQSLGGELDLYETIKYGDWTLSVFLEELKDLNATGYDISSDSHGTYALASNYLSHRAPMLWGAGVETTQLGDDKEWTMVWNTKANQEKIDSVLDYIHDLEDNVVFYNNYVFDPYSGAIRAEYYAELPNSVMLRLWNAKKVAFMLWDVGSMYHYLRTADFEIGYAPMPKLNTQQANYVSSTATIGLTMISRRDSMKRAEMTGAVLEGLARYSYVYTRPTFFEQIVGGRLSENPKDYEMLTLIYNSKYYRPDFAVAGSAYSGVVVGDPLRDSCSVYVAGNARNYQNIMEQINKMN